jgi:hypothetical protein
VHELHGYLSSPTGGGIRHGLDFNSGRPISDEEGRFFCNLILSYVAFLMAEHARLHQLIPVPRWRVLWPMGLKVLGE